MGKTEVIFIGGIHGVGKTTFCKNNYCNDFTHVTASKLIQEERSFLINNNKQVGDIPRNQVVLIEAITKLLKNNSKLVIDGHYCLVNKDHQIVSIDVEVFESMKITKLVLITSDPELIRKRLFKRDEKSWTIDFILDFQAKEIERANIIANWLNIELTTFHI